MLSVLTLPAWRVGADTTADAEESERERLNKNKVELFLGNAKNGSSNSASIGMSYERRFGQLFGFGGYVEYAGGGFNTYAVGTNFILHPHESTNELWVSSERARNTIHADPDQNRSPSTRPRALSMIPDHR